ncbi:tumor protein p53-inducible nuclear protein 2 [Denticeps clupeoides]|nr:tumor protein p53-inducible nuclear protein 2-like [Denticeps clupeoides]
MIGKIIAHIIGNTEEEPINEPSGVQDGSGEELLECEVGEWIIINTREDLTRADADPLDNLLIEHPSISVCNMKSQRTVEEDLSSDEEPDSPRPVLLRHHLSWRLAAWGSPVSCGAQLLSVQRVRAQAERRNSTRGALHRQNLSKTRFLPTERRLGYFKQPCQRLYNY